MSTKIRVVVTTVALLVASPLNSGQHNLAATSDMRELSISQVIGGTKVVIPIEVASGANGELYFRIGPFVPRITLLAEYEVSEAPAEVLQASSQYVR